MSPVRDYLAVPKHSQIEGVLERPETLPTRIRAT